MSKDLFYFFFYAINVIFRTVNPYRLVINKSQVQVTLEYLFNDANDLGNFAFRILNKHHRVNLEHDRVYWRFLIQIFLTFKILHIDYLCQIHNNHFSNAADYNFNVN